MTDYSDGQHIGQPGEQSEAPSRSFSATHFERADNNALQEIADIQKAMREKPDTYFKNEGLQSRYRDLLDKAGPPSAAAATNDPIEAYALIDRDVPPLPHKYEINDMFFPRGSFRPDDQAAFQDAFRVAYSEGIGQQKINDTLSFLSSRRDGSEVAFADWAIDRGWHDDHILVALDFGRKYKLWR